MSIRELNIYVLYLYIICMDCMYNHYLSHVNISQLIDYQWLNSLYSPPYVNISCYTHPYI